MDSVCMCSEGRRLTLKVRVTPGTRQGRRDLHFRRTVLAPEEPKFEEESREVEEEQGRYSNTCVGC